MGDEILKTEAAPRSETPSLAAAYYTIIVLAVVYMFSYVDRQIPTLLIELIEADLHISDTQASLLSGFAFALFYSTAAIPIARLADQWSRKGVILIGVAFWSVTTVICGLSRTFQQFFLARMGVGLGEAALTPSAYAMVHELFPADQRARGMGIFVVGSSIGTGLSLVLGGAAIKWAELAGPLNLPLLGHIGIWQMVIIGVGAATLLVLLPLLKIADSASASTRRNSTSLRELARILWCSRGAFAMMFFGVPLISLAAYGFLAWAPTYFMRLYGWEASETGIWLGVVSIPAGVLGVFAGSWLSDRQTAKGATGAPLRILLIATLLTAPVGLLFWFPFPAVVPLIGFAIFAFITGPVAALAPLALQAITPNGVRAQVSSLFLITANMIGLGFGPTIVALLTDYAFHDEHLVGRAIAIVTFVGFLISGGAIALGRNAYHRALALQAS